MRKHKERRVQYMLPRELRGELKRQPLIFLPLAPLEWHGPHLALGTDPINAERVALSVAARIGGVVLPTLFMGTERERAPEMLRSLGFNPGAYVVGMDFPKARGLYKSYYFKEELFAQAVRGHIELCIEHGYQYIFMVNGHGAVNHNEVLKRLCREFTQTRHGVTVAYGTSFPKRLSTRGVLGHADMAETALMRYYGERWVDLKRLPSLHKKLKYSDYSVVDGGGFAGHPGKGHTVPPEFDPRTGSNAKIGESLFEETVRDLSTYVLETFHLTPKGQA